MVSLFLREAPFSLSLYHSCYQQITSTTKQIKVEIITHFTPLLKQVTFIQKSTSNHLQNNDFQHRF
mgnify:FL=1